MSAVAYHVEDLVRDSTALLRDMARGQLPTVEAAAELVKHAQTVLAAVEASRVLRFASGQEVRLDELPERTPEQDRGAQRYVETRRAG